MDMADAHLQSKGPVPGPASVGLESRRLDYVDGLRALAAIYVVLHHVLLEIWPDDGLSAPSWAHWLRFGHESVDLFIVLSGFSLMLPVVRGDGRLRGGALNFYKKRARRILPPYYFALALSLLLIHFLVGKMTGTHWDVSLPATWHGVIIHILLLQNFSFTQIATINHAFWSISLEWWIYFLFPAMVLAWRRFGPGVTTLGVIIVSYAACSVLVRLVQNPFTLWYIGLFVLGLFAAELTYGHNSALTRVRERIPWTAATWAAFAIVLIALKLLPANHNMTDLMVGCWAVCLLVTLGTGHDHILGRALSRRPLVWIGSFAYSLYLIHAPLIQVIWQYALHPLHVGRAATFLLLEVIGTPAIVASSYGFFLLCERPFMNTPGKPQLNSEREAETTAVLNPAP